MKKRRASLPARIAGTIAGGVRQRQQEREPRAVLYDANGMLRVVPPDSDAQRELIEVAERLVELALEDGGAQPAEPADASEAPPE